MLRDQPSRPGTGGISMIRMFNQDCMEAMKAMPDKAFDLAIVDPPYGIDIVNQFKKTIKSESSMFNLSRVL